MVPFSLTNPKIPYNAFSLFLHEEFLGADNQGNKYYAPTRKNPNCPLWDHPLGVPSGIIQLPERANQPIIYNGIASNTFQTSAAAIEDCKNGVAYLGARNPQLCNGGFLRGIVLTDRKVGFSNTDAEVNFNPKYQQIIWVSNSDGDLFRYKLNPTPIGGSIEDRVFQLADGEPDFDPSLTRWITRFADIPFLDSVGDDASQYFLNGYWALNFADNGSKAVLSKMGPTAMASNFLNGAKLAYTPTTEISSQCISFSGDSHSVAFVPHATEGWAFFSTGRTGVSGYLAANGWLGEDPSLASELDRVVFNDINDFTSTTKISDEQDLKLNYPYHGNLRPVFNASNGASTSTVTGPNIQCYIEGDNNANWVITPDDTKRAVDFSDLDVFPVALSYVGGFKVPLSSNSAISFYWDLGPIEDVFDFYGNKYWTYNITSVVKRAGTTLGNLKIPPENKSARQGTEFEFVRSEHKAAGRVGQFTSEILDALNSGDTLTLEVTFEDSFGRSQTITETNIEVGNYALPTGFAVGVLSASGTTAGSTVSGTYSLTTAGFPSILQVEAQLTIDGTSYAVPCNETLVAGASNQPITFELPADTPPGFYGVAFTGVVGSGVMRAVTANTAMLIS